MKTKYKQPKDKQRSFEMNGGYIIDGISYMDCKITGEPVKNVSTDAKSVIGSRALIARMEKMFPEKPRRVRTGRPSGWRFMAEFVDKDGNVFHKGKEQPELKGTLPATIVKAKKSKKRLTKREREAKKRTLMAELYDLKKKYKKVNLKKDKKYI